MVGRTNSGGLCICVLLAQIPMIMISLKLVHNILNGFFIMLLLNIINTISDIY